jgi:hypothetical protein
MLAASLKNLILASIWKEIPKFIYWEIWLEINKAIFRVSFSLHQEFIRWLATSSMKLYVPRPRKSGLFQILITLSKTGSLVLSVMHTSNIILQLSPHPLDIIGNFDSLIKNLVHGTTTKFQSFYSLMGHHKEIQG